VLFAAIWDFKVKEMERVSKPISLILLTLFLTARAAFCQLHTDETVPKPVLELSRTTCFENASQLGDLNSRVNIESVIIIISHSGINERPDIGARRLNNASISLSSLRDPVRGRPLSRIITAEGKKSVADGYLDFFVLGLLELRNHLPKDRDLWVSPCVKEPGEKPCASKLERLFYPCKK
jgi:hypothetical protein